MSNKKIPVLWITKSGEGLNKVYNAKGSDGEYLDIESWRNKKVNSNISVIKSNLAEGDIGLETPLHDFDFASKSSSQENGAKKNVKVGNNLQGNALHKYSAINTIFTFAALTETEINYPSVLKQRPPQHIIAKSGGGYSPAHDGLELYVDEVEVNAYVSQSPKTGHSNATAINFKIHEPYSIGKTLEAMQLKAEAANNDIGGRNGTSHLHAQYALIIDFKGEQEAELTVEDIHPLRRIIHINVASMDFSVNQGGAVYSVEAFPNNQYIFSDHIAKIGKEIHLSGKTVGEVLQWGKNSLQEQLNVKFVKTYSAPDPGSYSADQGYGKIDKRKPYDFAIFFPKSNQLLGKSLNDAPDYDGSEGATIKSVDKDMMTDSVVKTLEAGIQSKAGKHKIGKKVKSLFGKGVDASVNYDSGLRLNQQTIVGVDKFGEPITSNFTGNEIGESVLVTDDTFYDNLGRKTQEIATGSGTTGRKSTKVRMAMAGKAVMLVYDKETDTYNRGAITFDPKARSFSFARGTPISTIIEQVILLSKWAGTLPDRISKKKNGLVDWFKIVPSRFQLSDSAILKATGRHPEIYVYSIIAHEVVEGMFLSPRKYANNMEQLKELCNKKYTYLYKGVNKDVLDFNIDIKAAFYSKVPPDDGAYPQNHMNVKGGGIWEDKAQFGVSQEGTGPNVKGQFTGQVINGSVSGLSGQGTETNSIRVARYFNDMILNSNIDLAVCDLKIMGDVYWMPNTGMSNYQAKYVVTDEWNRPEGFRDDDNTAPFTLGQICLVLEFRSPLDYNDEGGMDFPTQKASSDQSTLKGSQGENLQALSGIWRVIMVNSQFVNGKFEQTLSLVRINNQPLAKPVQTTEAVVTKSDGIEKDDNFKVDTSKVDNLNKAAIIKGYPYWTPPNKDLKNESWNWGKMRNK